MVEILLRHSGPILSSLDFFLRVFSQTRSLRNNHPLHHQVQLKKDRKGRRKSLDAVNLKGKVVDSDESDVDDKLEEVGNTC